MIYITHIFPHDIPIAILYYSRQTCPAAVDRLRAAEKVVAQLPLGQLFVIDLLGLHVISAVNPSKSQTQDQVFRSSFFISSTIGNISHIFFVVWSNPAGDDCTNMLMKQ